MSEIYHGYTINRSPLAEEWAPEFVTLLLDVAFDGRQRDDMAGEDYIIVLQSCGDLLGVAIDEALHEAMTGFVHEFDDESRLEFEAMVADGAPPRHYDVVTANALSSNSVN